MHQSHELWFERLFQDPDFYQLYVSRWQALRRNTLSDDSIAKTLKDLADQIGAANAVKQGIPTEADWRNRIENMKSWILKRARFFDESFPEPPKLTRHGDTITLSARSGSVYYTTDGSDPRGDNGLPRASGKIALKQREVRLVPDDVTIKILVPDGPGVHETWVSQDFDDTAWTTGQMPLGYDKESTFAKKIRLDTMSTMWGSRASVYIRIPFEVTEDPSTIRSLTLNIACDDGFVAYLNGRAVA
jgi:hypothetical protein